MYSYYTTSYGGRTIHIIKAQADSNHEVCLSVMADRYDSADPLKIASDFSDGYLESNGYSRVGILNGGIFDQEGIYWFANGVEKAFWNEHEPNDDANLDNVMAFGHDGNASNLPVLDIQNNIQANLGAFRGALTGAFGLIRNGVTDQGNISAQGNYSIVSGRAMLGVGWDSSIYLIATQGSTNTSGLTGSQCLAFVRDVLGLKDAIALDGGGSVSMVYEGTWRVPTSGARQIKNAIGLYVKQKSSGGTTDGGETPATVRVCDVGYLPITDDGVDHMINIDGSVLRIKEVLVKSNGILVPVNEIRKETG